MAAKPKNLLTSERAKKILRRQFKSPDTPHVQRIRLHYKKAGLDKGWPMEKFYALCHYMQVTERELAVLINASYPNLKQWRARGEISRPASLVLELVRQFYIAQKTGVLSPPIMPIHVLMCRGRGDGATSASATPTTNPSSITEDSHG